MTTLNKDGPVLTVHRLNKAFLGVMLLLAVVVNLYVKKLSTARKVG